MMSLFGTIFQMSVQVLTVQRGVVENDQRVRLTQNLLRNDLNDAPYDRQTGNPRPARTFRLLIPYAANESIPPRNPATGETASSADRRGYFSISENDSNDDTDDVLALTVEIPNGAAERFYGRAAGLLADAAGNFGPSAANPPAGVPPPPPALAPPGNYWPNQPEFDDTFGAPNQTGSSTAAEVCYFCRHGNLYRRVMIIRRPELPNLPDDHTPADTAGAQLSTAAYGTGGPRNFWTDFDYAAVYDSDQTPPGVRFLGMGDLTGVSAASTLLNPTNRWGFDRTSPPGTSLGLPREFAGAAFIGRFTHAETSDPGFGYPGRMDAARPNPLA